MALIDVSALDHVHLYGPDPQALAQWYTRTLGIAPHPSNAKVSDPDKIYMATPRGQYCATIFRGNPPSDGDHTTAFRVPGSKFIAFAELLPHPDIPARPGVALKPADHGLAWSLYFADPAGNHLEITTYDHQTVRNWAQAARS